LYVLLTLATTITNTLHFANNNSDYYAQKMSSDINKCHLNKMCSNMLVKFVHKKTKINNEIKYPTERKTIIDHILLEQMPQIYYL
jgi:hypothetical protein